MKMSILYYFPEYPTNMFYWQHIHFINELESHGVNITAFNPLKYESIDEANTLFKREISCNKYDLIMSSTCYDKMLYPETMKEAKRLGIPTLCIRWDNLIVPFQDKALARYFDLVWLTSFETEHLYKKWKANTVFLPYAANPDAFIYTESQIVNKACFIGTPYGSRSIMINTLTESGVKVDLYSGKNPNLRKDMPPHIEIKTEYATYPYWKYFVSNFLFREGRKVVLGKIANKMKGSTVVLRNDNLNWMPSCAFNEISLNYSKYALCLSSTSTNNTDALKNPLKVINLRAFEIPMSGGITLCKYNQELANYFEEDKEIIFYHTNDELVDKAKYYTQKASDSEIYAIKRAARKRAENEHTWWKRFCVAFDLLGISYK